MPRKRAPTGEYAVGYGRPPEATRFRPGQSGNPRGRPKGSQDLATVLRTALASRVTVNEGGRPRTMTKLEVIVLTNVNKASKGDARALREVLTLAERVGLGGEAAAAIQAAEPTFGADELDVIARFMARESGPAAAEIETTTKAEAPAAPARVSTATRENPDEAL